MKFARESLFYSVIAIFIATAFITLGGVVGFITIQAKYLDLFIYALIIELVAAVVGLFKSTDWFGKTNDSISTSLVLGGWWQFIRYQRDNAISFFTISYSSEQQQLLLDGYAYDAAGNRYAHWWSLGVGFNAATYKLFYFWSGDQEVEEDDFSGVGIYRFSKSFEKGDPDQASGWFSTGNIDHTDVTGKQKVELRRSSAEELGIMTSPDTKAKSRLASSVYAKWTKATGD